MGHRSQADRDAMTVEIGFAVVTGALLAGAAFLTVCAPALLLTSRDSVPSALFMAATAVAALVFVGRVVDVLWRFGHRDTGPEIGRHGPVLPDQPSQPGRTRPDS